ncbi:MAG TPA: hypothetical protein VN901_08990 [Candidatus Acidoferrales bacterium]|nr:hypothetical protein [Candidatus Acidoferrales bacterium]
MLNTIQHLSIITTMPELASSYAFGEYFAPLMAIMPVDHCLAAQGNHSPKDLVGESFVGVSSTAPVLREVIDGGECSRGVRQLPDI